MAKNLSSILRGTNYGTLPISAGGTGVTAAGITGNVLTSNGTAWVSQTAPISLPSQTSHSGKYLTTDGGTALWSAISSGLVATAIKTASYTASVNELVRCNTSSAAFNITFPATPEDGAIIGVIDINNTFATNAITLLANGNTIEDDSVGVMLDVNGTYVSFMYTTSTSNWRLLETPSGMPHGETGVNAAGTTGNVLTSNGTTWVSQAAPISLPSQTGNTDKYLTTDGATASWVTVKTGLSVTALKTSAYTAVANDLIRCDTAAAAFSITFPASPADGVMIGIIDIAGAFGTNNLTILPNTGKTIESDATSYILDISGASVTFVYSTSTTNWRLMETPLAVSIAVVGAGVATNINGILSGNGSILSGVTLKTINSNSLIGSGDITLANGALGTPVSGILTNCTGYTYARLSGTIPTWNQNTTGTAAGLSSTLAVNKGGTGTTTLTGMLKGNGTSAFAVAIAGTDFVSPGGALGTPSSGALTNCTGYTYARLSGTVPTWNQNTSGTAAGLSSTLAVNKGGTGATTLTGILKGNGTGALTAATAGIDYSAGTSTLSTGILLSTASTGALSIAIAGTDFVSPDGALGTPSSGVLTNCTGYTYANLSGTAPTWNQNTTGTAANVTGTVAIANGGTGATTAVDALAALNAQAALVSGTNIKTINGNSLLGSADITISGVPTGKAIAMSMIFGG